MSLLSICEWLRQTSTGTGIRESMWTFPIIETVHLLSVALSVGTILFVALRLISAGMRRQPVSEVMRRPQPWALGGFAMSGIGFL